MCTCDNAYSINLGGYRIDLFKICTLIEASDAVNIDFSYRPILICVRVSSMQEQNCTKFEERSLIQKVDFMQSCNVRMSETSSE